MSLAEAYFCKMASMNYNDLMEIKISLPAERSRITRMESKKTKHRTKPRKKRQFKLAAMFKNTTVFLNLK